MDFDRNSMTVPVQSSDYTNKFLQKDSNLTPMEVVTQTNPSSLRLIARQPRSWCTRWKRSHECWPSACALPITCATAPPSSVSCGWAEASVCRRTVSMRGSTGQLDKEATVWHILRSVATLTAFGTSTKMSTARVATNGRAFPPKRRQRTEKSRSSMSWRPALF